MEIVRAQNIMDCPMIENDAEAKTIGQYLSRLLITLIKEDEGFSSKRPFGNSGWFDELSGSLALGGYIQSEKSENYVEGEDHPLDQFIKIDHMAAERLLIEAVDVYFS